MTAWDYINIFARLVLTALSVYKLTQFGEMMLPVERLGLSMMGGGSFLTIPVLIEKRDSPMDGWAVTVLTVGAVVFLAGRTWRDRKHQRANDAMIAATARWREGR